MRRVQPLISAALTARAPSGKEATDSAATSPSRSMTPKLRACLRCAVSFESAWVGERICPNCKRSKLWAAGIAPRPSTLGRHR